MSDEAETKVIPAVWAGGVALDPAFDALVMEAVFASGEQNADVVPFELHKADGARTAHIWVSCLNLCKRFSHV